MSTFGCLLQRQQRGPAGGCLRRTHPHCNASRGSCSTGTHLWAQCVPPTEAPACGGTCPQSTCRHTWAQLWLPGNGAAWVPSQPANSIRASATVGRLLVTLQVSRCRVWCVRAIAAEEALACRLRHGALKAYFQRSIPMSGFEGAEPCISATFSSCKPAKQHGLVVHACVYCA